MTIPSTDANRIILTFVGFNVQSYPTDTMLHDKFLARDFADRTGACVTKIEYTCLKKQKKEEGGRKIIKMTKRIDKRFTSFASVRGSSVLQCAIRSTFYVSMIKRAGFTAFNREITEKGITSVKILASECP